MRLVVNGSGRAEDRRDGRPALPHHVLAGTVRPWAARFCETLSRNLGRSDEGVALDADKEQLRQYVRTWAANGPLLEVIRDREIREADTATSIGMFEQAFRIALRELPPRESSGLVRWQDRLNSRRRRG